jgi:ubiquinone/menaquinone biosynthesis C-methylase UbiE
MEDVKQEDRWFSTPVIDTWCRMGGNGTINVSQLMPLIKFTRDGESFLDVGCGSGTTIDAIDAIKRDVVYKGVDFIERNVNWLKEKYPHREFAVEDARHLTEPDQSWDVVWSRHVVDHLDDFEQPLEEHCRVAKKRVICVLWYALHDGDEHIIKPIFDNGRTYADEYLNQFSRKKVKAFLDKKSKEGWQLLEFLEEVSWQGDKKGKGGDIIIVLGRV